MKKLNLVVATLCAATLPLLASAQQDNIERSQPTIDVEKEKREFQQLDANKDGALSMEEAKNSTVSDFAKADVNQDNKLSLGEYVSAARTDVGRQ